MTPLKKIVPVLFFGTIFALVINQVTPPSSFTDLSFWQIPAFFLPLFFLLAFLLNSFLNFFLKSTVISLGIVILFILKGLDTLNPVSVTLTGIAVVLVVRSLRKPKGRLPQSNIPKLSHLKRQS